MRVVYVGGVGVLVASIIAAILATGGTSVKANLWVSSTGGSCTRSASQVDYNSSQACGTILEAADASQTGDLVLVKAGNYGFFDGTDKAITIRAAEGEHSTLGLYLRSGDCCFTIDGGPSLKFEINDNGGPSIGSGVTDVTIKNINFTTSISIDNPGPNANIVFDHNWHHNVGGQGNPPGALTFAYGDPTSCGCTVENSLFQNFSADGIQTGTGLLVRNNIFQNILPANVEEHTDNVQSVGAIGLTVRGNLVTGNCEQGITSFDGGSNLTFTHNVVAGCTAHWLSAGAHDTLNPLTNATVTFNTIDTRVQPGSTINCEHVSGATIRNNISGDLFLNGCDSLTRTTNMLAGAAAGSDFTGLPTFAGGSTRKNFRDYCLAAGSAGYTGASDGGQVGACGEGFTGGPPIDWYVFPGAGL